MSDKLLRVIAYAFPRVLVLQIVITVFVAWSIYRSCYKYITYKVSTVRFRDMELHMPGAYHKNLDCCVRGEQDQSVKPSTLAISVPT